MSKAGFGEEKGIERGALERARTSKTDVCGCAGGARAAGGARGTTTSTVSVASSKDSATTGYFSCAKRAPPVSPSPFKRASGPP